MSITHPTDPNATQVDSFNASVPLTYEYWEQGTHKKANGIATSQITVFATSGDNEYVIDATSTTFTGETLAIDNNSASTIYELTSVEAVKIGVGNNDTPCPTDCEAPAETKAWVQGCVERHDSGTSTYFTECSGSTWGYRDVTTCCPTPETPNVLVVGRSGPTCTGGCEATCDAPS